MTNATTIIDRARERSQRDASADWKTYRAILERDLDGKPDENDERTLDFLRYDVLKLDWDTVHEHSALLREQRDINARLAREDAVTAHCQRVSDDFDAAVLAHKELDARVRELRARLAQAQSDIMSLQNCRTRLTEIERGFPELVGAAHSS